MTPSIQFAALADDTRCALVDLLRERPRPVHELAAAFPISRPAISRHLKVLKDAGLVREEKLGRENIYALESSKLISVDRWITRLWGAHMTRLQRRSRGRAAVGDLFALE